MDDVLEVEAVFDMDNDLDVEDIFNGRVWYNMNMFVINTEGTE